MQLTANEFYKVRKVYRLSSAEFGALCDISAPYVNMIENGKRNLTRQVKYRLIDELQLTPEKLARILEIYQEYKL